jgi:hypothetical protein
MYIHRQQDRSQVSKCGRNFSLGAEKTRRGRGKAAWAPFTVLIISYQNIRLAWVPNSIS